jgi:hypothetical protein
MADLARLERMRAEIRGEKGKEANINGGDTNRQRLSIMKNRSKTDISLLASTYTNTSSLASTPPFDGNKIKSKSKPKSNSSKL